MPNLTFGDTAKEYGTINSATLIAESNYFVAANLNIVAELNALHRSPIYNYNIYGFQETSNDKGNHFFKDYYVSGTVDFIFGSGKSLYLREGRGFTVITTQARESSSEDMGHSFVHGSITGTANNSFLGAWRSNPRVVYAFTEMSNVVNTAGWSHNRFPKRAK
ncbi:putative pectinesterase 63 [Gossypium hirsutum]|uniref:Pectinesterase n=1 Tax=Gossypium hirsutum TaxID=3635 RepID=A0ABM2ZBX8_GOSHI|nr:putative pectinesterase 63 [Gossypium hirsutum]